VLGSGGGGLGPERRLLGWCRHTLQHGGATGRAQVRARGLGDGLRVRERAMAA